MQETLLVHATEPIQNRRQYRLGLIFRERASLQHILERPPSGIIHHEIGGVVGLKYLVHPHDVGMSELRERPRFVQETIQAPIEVVLVGGALGCDARILLPHCKVAGQVLLDSHYRVERRVARHVGDAEPACAQYADKLVLVQARSGGQRMDMFYHRTVTVTDDQLPPASDCRGLKTTCYVSTGA